MTKTVYTDFTYSLVFDLCCDTFGYKARAFLVRYQ